MSVKHETRKWNINIQSDNPKVIKSHFAHCILEGLGTKGSFYIRKEFNSNRVVLVQQHGRRFICFGTPIWPPRRQVKMF